MPRRTHRALPAAILRAVIYARVSKDDAGRGRSCAEQIKGCTEDCEYEGWPIGQVLMDNDRGASRHSRGERKDYATLPNVLQAGDVLVVWEPSRITRNMKEFGDFCDLLAEKGVRLYYDGRTWDLNDDDDRNRVWQDILDGAKAAGKTRKRVLRAMSANVEDCKPHGREAPGYRIERDPRTGRAIGRRPEPRQAAILQEAAQRILNFESRRSVSMDLAERWKEAGGGRFDVTDIKRILTSPTTFGYRVHYGEIVGKMAGESAVDPELYAPLQGLLNNAERYTHHGTQPKYLLSHIARCSVCLEMGEPGIIQRKRRTKKARGGDRYQCWSFGHVSHVISTADAYVEELLLQLLEDPATEAKLTAQDASERASVDAEWAKIDHIQAEIKTYVADAAKTRMSAAVVAAYVEPLEADIAQAHRRIDEMTKPVDPALARIVGSGARELWASPEYTMEMKRETIRAAMSIVILPLRRDGRKLGDIRIEVEPVI